MYCPTSKRLASARACPSAAARVTVRANCAAWAVPSALCAAMAVAIWPAVAAVTAGSLATKSAGSMA
jgi:hypothetical protein